MTVKDGSRLFTTRRRDPIDVEEASAVDEADARTELGIQAGRNLFSTRQSRKEPNA